MATESTILDLSTGKTVKDTAIERARQDLIRTLVNDYGYAPADLRIDYRAGTGRARTFDLAVVPTGLDRPLPLVAEIAPGKSFEETTLRRVGPDLASVLVWYNGEDLHVFATGQETEGLRRLPHLPRKGESTGHFGKYTKSDLRPAEDLRPLFRRIHNVLYGSSNMRLASRLSDELIKLVFCKIFDERSSRAACEFGISIKEMEDEKGQQECARRIQALFGQVKRSFPEVFGKDEQIELDARSVAFVVGELEPFSLQATSLDAVGAAFEVFLGSHTKGEKGEFFTPRPVVLAAVEIILANVPTSAISDLRFIDPAMGTAGFLSVFLDRAKAAISSSGGGRATEKLRRLEENAVGIDIEAEQVRIARAYMAIMGNRGTQLFRADSLQRPERWEAGTRDNVPLNGFDVILTNPPFGTKIPVSDEQVLNQYELARKWISAASGPMNQFVEVQEATTKWRLSTSNDVKPQVPDILFIERCMALLKSGSKCGTMGIVLPRQILSGDDKQSVRQWLFNNATIRAVIDLPVEAFQPFTGTKTSLVFLEKGRASKDPDIFMAVSEVVGHDRRGAAIYQRDSRGGLVHDSKGGRVIANDLPEIVAAYRSFMKGAKIQSDKCFVKKRSEVEFSRSNQWGRLDASFYSPRETHFTETNIPTGWKVVKLGEIADVTYPGRFKRNYVDAEHGIPFLSGNDATQLEPDTKFLAPDSPGIDEYMIKPGWTLITRSGTVGIVQFVGERLSRAAASEHLLRVIPKPGSNAGYLYAFLSSEIGVAAIKQGIYGSVVDEITPDYVKSILVPLPPQAIQQQIGNLVLAAEKKRTEAQQEVSKARHSILSALGSRPSEILATR